MFPNSLIHIHLVRTRQAELVGRLARPQSRRRPDGRSLPWVSARRHLLRCVRRAASGESVHFAHREGAGITVDLYWTHGEFDEFRVDVVDRCSEIEFSLHPATGKEAIAAYHHPFAAITSTGDSAGATSPEAF